MGNSSAEKRLSWWRGWLCAWRGHAHIKWIDEDNWQCRHCGAVVRLYGR